MGRDEFIDIIDDGGGLVQARSPVIISANRLFMRTGFSIGWRKGILCGLILLIMCEAIFLIQRLG